MLASSLSEAADITRRRGATVDTSFDARALAVAPHLARRRGAAARAHLARILAAAGDPARHRRRARHERRGPPLDHADAADARAAGSTARDRLASIVGRIEHGRTIGLRQTAREHQASHEAPARRPHPQNGNLVFPAAGRAGGRGLMRIGATGAAGVTSSGGSATSGTS